MAASLPTPEGPETTRTSGACGGTYVGEEEERVEVERLKAGERNTKAKKEKALDDINLFSLLPLSNSISLYFRTIGSRDRGPTMASSGASTASRAARLLF